MARTARDRTAAIALFCASMYLQSSQVIAAGEAQTPDATPTEPAAASDTPDPAAAPAPYAESIAVGQDTAPAPAVEKAPPSSGLAEVIVTAQRRAENLQKVPVSITVLSQEQITKANITNSGDLARYTPSLAVNSRFGEETATFTIRGFTQDLRTTASVGTYFAEVVAPRGQSTQTSGDGAGPGSLFDLENVQVLKGPQGTSLKAMQN